jgi:hypothetical protein
MMEEEVWTPVKKLIQWLSYKRIAQIWLHHTGHDTSKGFGTKTREWEMDSVVILSKLANDGGGDDGSVAPFGLKFTKARLRTPHNFRDFEDKKVWRDAEGFKFEGGCAASKPERQQSDHQIMLGIVRKTYEKLAANVAPDTSGARKVSVNAMRDDMRSRGYLETNESGKLVGRSRQAFSKAKSALTLKGGYEELEGLFWEKVVADGGF